ncbi:MAG: sigma-54 dependent transcriptional regulator [Nitrospira sp.]|nr:sigma-54-dependent Fis family transcriptional regulator [Candidatus Manganitrophaceae bacterium]HIL34576.1 sigma-54-dependent Fis family transcriptional regulator [Candidatus Manganitrophaceae bacterium]
METILIVEDRESLAKMLSQALTDAGYKVIWAKDGREGISMVREKKMDFVVTDLKLPYQSGLEVLHEVKAKSAFIPVIVMTAYGSIEVAVKAVKAGAYDFISKPFDPDHLLLQIEKALEKKRLVTENIILKEIFSSQLGFPRIIGKSPPMAKVLEQIQKVAQGKTTVLLMGESGTGKELFARAVHMLSPRKDNAFVAINCAAIPHDLLESEFFGHERGAFTGAIGKKIGKFELADKGTVFLDEIGEMDLSLQSKLLRVLEAGELMRVGGTTNVKIDARIVAATNQVLPKLIQEKRFREDLFFRLNVFPIVIPPLRDRREDIPILASHFISHYSKEMNKDIIDFTPEAMDLLKGHLWKGNVRELQNCIERAIILSDGNKIHPSHLGLKTREKAKYTIPDIPLEGTLQGVSDSARSLVESRMIRKILKETGGNKTRAAERLQVSYKTLLTKIKEYGIERR